MGLPWPSTRIPEGAVVVLSPNHVGFFSGFEGDRVFLLGGNQSDRVDKTPFPQSQIVAVRWLNLAPAQDAERSAPGPGHRRHALQRAVGDISRQAGRDGVRQQLWRGEQARLLRPLAIRRRCSCRRRLCARRHQQQEFALARGLDRQGWREQPRRLVVPARCAERGHARLHARALQWPAQERRASAQLVAGAHRRASGRCAFDGPGRRAAAGRRHDRARRQRHHHAANTTSSCRLPSVAPDGWRRSAHERAMLAAPLRQGAA